MDAALDRENELWGTDWAVVRAHWDLDPMRAHLNHGSFGAVPRMVRQAQERWRRIADANPMRYYRTRRMPAIAAARHAAAAFLDVPTDGLALVANATAGVSTVLSSVSLSSGDEIVVTNHTYGAVALAARRFAHAVGARVVTVDLPLAASDAEVVRRLAAGITRRTRLVLLDQVTSPTARILPVRDVAELTRAEGIVLVVDGAHVPGMLATDIASMGADFWVGNFHKWAFAARSVAALWVAPAWRSRIRPLVVSWNEDEPFPRAFDQQGTMDDSAWLALPDALSFLADLGVERLRRHNTELATHAQASVASALGVSLAEVPSDPRVTMRLVPLPRGTAETEAGATALYERISMDLRAEVAVVHWSGRGYLRLSAQAYNRPSEYDQLGARLADLLR